MEAHRRVRIIRMVGEATDVREDGEDFVSQRLFEAEALFRDFEQVTPFEFVPFVKTFDSFEAFEDWKRGQDNPWYR